MKTRASLFALSFSAGLMALSLTGCSTFSNSSIGPDATKPVGGKAINLLQLRDSVKATRVALNRTTDALSRVTTPGALEAYDAYSQELAAFRKLSAATRKQSADVRNDGRDLFAQWDRETQSIQNPDIRAVAEQRRVTLQKSYDSMLPPLIEARDDLNAVTSDLIDIQKALSLDLTKPGIDAAQRSVSQVNRKATTATKSLDRLAAELDKIAAALPAPVVAPVK